MNIARSSLLGMFAVLFAFGCSNGAAGEEDINEGAATVEDVNGISLDFVQIENKKDPTTPVTAADEYSLTQCETNVEYVAVRGTKADDKVNALLKSAAGDGACDVPETIETSSTIHFLNKNFISVGSAGSYYSAGAAHPNYGVDYKNIDITTGELITLDKILAPAAKDTLLRSIRAQIGAKKWVEIDPQTRKQTVTKIDEASKDVLVHALTWELDQPLKEVTFALSSQGVRIDLSNQLPHAYQGVDAVFKVKWKALDRHILPAIKPRLTIK